MAYYGITSESQLIDYNTIKNGCTAYMDALDYFLQASQLVKEAAEIGDKNAMDIDGESVQPYLYDLAEEIAQAANDFAGAVNELNIEAVGIYNEQVRELNAYYAKMAQQQAANNNGNSN